MNLLTDDWIPVVRRSGAHVRIAPPGLTSEHDSDPVLALAALRPDFTGALVQFLIGLLQTTFAPETPRDWRRRFDPPPPPRDLSRAFAPDASCFELDAEPGPRFMQDLTLFSEDAKTVALQPVERLLIDAAGDNTIERNTDHFVKRERVATMCLPCAATALFTLQTNAPSGGQGHRTGLRGGGPLTTLVQAETLWKTVWLNVLHREAFHSLANTKKSKAEHRFPWMARTRTSEKEGGRDTTPEDAHPDQIYWAMPRRIRLVLETPTDGHVSCGLCAHAANRLVRSYKTKNLGVNYQGPWAHPLSPHGRNKEGDLFPVHTPGGGVGYRHWLGLVQDDTEGSRAPAKTVHTFKEDKQRRERSRYRLWAFGYEMDNMKALCWYDRTMPLILADETARKQHEAVVAACVRAARLAAFFTVSTIKAAFSRRPGDLRGDLSSVEQRFWNATESTFFAEVLPASPSAESDVRARWHRAICRAASDIFHEHAQAGLFQAVEPGRIAKAWNDLQRSLRGKKMLSTLGLATRDARGTGQRGGRGSK